MSRTVTFRQADVQRAVKGVRAEGLPVSGVEITRDGTIRVLTEGVPSQQVSDLQRWRASRDARRAAQGS